MTNSISETIGQLDTRRRIVGFNSPEGWILTKAIEQLKSLQKAETEKQRSALMGLLPDTIMRLAEVRQAGEG